MSSLRRHSNIVADFRVLISAYPCAWPCAACDNQEPMETQILVLRLALALCPTLAIAQSQPASHAAAAVLVKAGRLLDVRKGSYIQNAGYGLKASVQGSGSILRGPDARAERRQNHRLGPSHGLARSGRLPYAYHGSHSGYGRRVRAQSGDEIASVPSVGRRLQYAHHFERGVYGNPRCRE